MTQHPRYKTRGQTRNGLVGRRQRRRSHRRDFPASRFYEPLPVDPQAATRGVQTRLFWALISALVTVSCITLALTVVASPMELSFVISVGFVSLSSAVVLLLSARREEMVHEIATQLTDVGEKDITQKLLHAGEDGSLAYDGTDLRSNDAKLLREPVFPDGVL